MRKTLSFVLCVAMLLSACVFAIPANAAPEGTAINTADDFLNMAAEGTYYLNADITVPATYPNAFKGTFDGNGHTIANFYQNTWEMKGDHDWYSPEEQYYRDGMGLFGRVYGGTVKNLTVKNFSSDGEFTPTGCIAAFAGGGSETPGYARGLDRYFDVGSAA